VGFVIIHVPDKYIKFLVIVLYVMIYFNITTDFYAIFQQ